MLAAPDSVLARVAAKIGITPAQAAIAWLLRRSPSLVTIPGTSRPDHLRENVAAAELVLTDDQYAEIERVGERAARLRAPASQLAARGAKRVETSCPVELPTGINAHTGSHGRADDPARRRRRVRTPRR